MKPELRKRLVDSIEYLRKMDFFEDYSGLTSEEILNKILWGKIRYWISWWGEERRISHGEWDVRAINKRWRHYLKASDFEIDYLLILFDAKRVVLEEPETVPDDKIGVAMLNRLARISRGIFQPTNVSARWLTPYKSKWLIQEVSFDFKGKRHSIEIVLDRDWIEDMGLRELNKFIEDTGYQYYKLKEAFIELITVVVLKEEEAEKLKEERGWKFDEYYLAYRYISFLRGE
ncbi:MAG: hypothetical protein FGF50_08950 [Candidatus Brockarchaeota archaeon]|nr:hypothetical protein [Candidatus Brockarchaeota archaeon]